MISSVEQWINMLQTSDPMFGIPMLVLGIVFLLFGLKLGRFCVAISFGLFGFWASKKFIPESDYSLYLSIGATLVCMCTGFLPRKTGSIFVGGLMTATAVWMMVGSATVDVTASFILIALMFIAGSFCAKIYPRFTMITISSLQGAVLTLSALGIFMIHSMSMASTMRDMIASSWVVAPFVFAVPMVVGIFYQLSVRDS